jgi:hypothetical protein
MQQGGGDLARSAPTSTAIPLARLFFNVGVEIGQVLFIGVVLAIMALALRYLAAWIDLKVAPKGAAYAIGGLSAFWVIERVASF